MIKDGNIRKCPNIKDEASGGDGISQKGGHGKTTELLAIYKYEVATFGQGGSGGGTERHARTGSFEISLQRAAISASACVKTMC